MSLGLYLAGLTLLQRLLRGISTLLLDNVPCLATLL